MPETQCQKVLTKNLDQLKIDVIFPHTGLKKFLLLQKLKILFRGQYVIIDAKGKEIVGKLY